MTLRRWLIAGTLFLLLSIGAELVVRSWRASTGSVQIVNQGDSPMDAVVVTYGNTRVTVGSLTAGQATNVWLTAAGKDTLNLEFHQKGNPLNGFQVPNFDPTENLANRLRLILVVTNSRVERFMDDEPSSSSPWTNIVNSVTGWFDPADPQLR